MKLTARVQHGGCLSASGVLQQISRPDVMAHRTGEALEQGHRVRGEASGMGKSGAGGGGGRMLRFASSSENKAITFPGEQRAFERFGAY